MNEALQEVIELTRAEALKNGVSVESQLAKGLPIIAGDRVQLRQVVPNLILNALQPMGAVSDGARQVLITTRQIELNDLCVGVQDTGPGLMLYLSALAAGCASCDVRAMGRRSK